MIIHTFTICTFYREKVYFRFLYSHWGISQLKPRPQPFSKFKTPSSVTDGTPSSDHQLHKNESLRYLIFAEWWNNGQRNLAEEDMHTCWECNYACTCFLNKYCSSPKTIHTFSVCAAFRICKYSSYIFLLGLSSAVGCCIYSGHDVSEVGL